MAPLLGQVSYTRQTYFIPGIHLLATNLHPPAGAFQVERKACGYMVILRSSLHHIICLFEILDQDNLFD